MEGGFVVILIGMRINAFCQPHKWWRVAQAMQLACTEPASQAEF